MVNLALIGSVLVVLSLSVLALINVAIFVVLLANLRKIWLLRKEELKELGDYIAKKVEEDMTR